jgi:hypothetical protein
LQSINFVEIEDFFEPVAKEEQKEVQKKKLRPTPAPAIKFGAMTP